MEIYRHRWISFKDGTTNRAVGELSQEKNLPVLWVPSWMLAPEDLQEVNSDFSYRTQYLTGCPNTTLCSMSHILPKETALTNCFSIISWGRSRHLHL